MLQKYMLSANGWQKILIKLISFIISAIFTLGFLMCIAAFVIIRVDTPEYILIPLTTLLLTTSSFINSFLLGKTYKENGLIIGIISGIIFTVIIVAISIYYHTFYISNILFTKIAAVMTAGILGGILGVNT